MPCIARGSGNYASPCILDCWVKTWTYSFLGNFIEISADQLETVVHREVRMDAQIQKNKWSLKKQNLIKFKHLFISLIVKCHRLTLTHCCCQCWWRSNSCGVTTASSLSHCIFTETKLLDLALWCNYCVITKSLYLHWDQTLRPCSETRHRCERLKTGFRPSSD